MEKPILLHDSPSFVDLCTLHQHAMRYYRLWIYACNTVLALATLVFTVFAVSVLVDPRISLLSGVELYQPTFLYAYVALLLQCGVLQAIGCLGALRLNQKLLNTYWTLLLILMIGDIIVGLVWAFRLDRIKSSLRPALLIRLNAHYGSDPDFTQVWDWVQAHDMCCGVDGPSDYQRRNDSSSSTPGHHFEVNWSHYETSSALYQKLPSTCCTFSIANPIPPNFSTDGNQKKGSTDAKRPYNNQQIFQQNSIIESHLQSNLNNLNNNQHPNNYINLGALQGSGSGGGSGVMSGGSNAHRRRIAHTSRKHFEKPDVNHQVQSKATVGFVHTTTETTAPLPSSYGVCALPPHLTRNSLGSITPSPNSFDDSQNSNHPLGSGSSGSGAGSGSSSYSSAEVSSSSKLINSVDTSTTQSSPTSPTLPTPPSSSSYFTSRLPTPETSTATAPPPPTTTTTTTTSAPIVVSMRQHGVGCAVKILEWLDHVTDVLFVIGFCIIVFLKGCFLAILRYEIKEMIQKIRLMNGEGPANSAAMNELIGLTSLYENGSEGGEGEELIATVVPGDTSNTNVDALESDKFIKSDGGGEGGDKYLGNNVNATAKRSYGNHIGTNNTAANKHEIEDDYDSSSTLLGRYNSSGRKYRNQNGGGRAVPLNGNNNSSSTSAPIPIEAVATVNTSSH